MDSLKFAKKIAGIVLSKKGTDIRLLDLKKLSGISDYFLICSADSDRQVKAIADEVDKILSEEGVKCIHREGFESLNWVILDYFDVIVHVFKNETRQFYGLEKLWGDAPVIFIEDELPNMENEVERVPKRTVRKSIKKS
ncbi:MAG: ribosome silencing factor [Ignavibacteriaceae bacterium]|nr:ribosome silencing factor [Ignavibacteriaceae bacterium]